MTEAKKKWTTLFAVVIILAAICFVAAFIWHWKCGPGGPDMELDTLDGSCQIYWNGKDVSDFIVTKTSEFDNFSIKTVPIQTQASSSPYLKPPQVAFSIGTLDVSPPSGYLIGAYQTNVGDTVGVSWSELGSAWIYAQNGKTISKLSFSGLDDSDLWLVSYDGILFHVSKPGEQVLTCEVEDNFGIVTTAKLYFTIGGETVP